VAKRRIVVVGTSARLPAGARVELQLDPVVKPAVVRPSGR
jgi:hypothetical protein